MKELLDKLLQRHKYLEPTAEEELRRQVNVLYGAFTGLIGSEKMVLRASKYSALSYIHSEDPRQRLVGLQRLIYEDVSYDKVPDDEEVINVLNELEMVLAEMLARQAVEERLEKKSASAWMKKPLPVMCCTTARTTALMPSAPNATAKSRPTPAKMEMWCSISTSSCPRTNPA